MMKLTEWMIKRGYNDEKMAKMVGVSAATISRLRRGKNKPTGLTIVRIEAVTNGECSASDFFPAHRN
jgi:transcriptional regulator with XRE-family HTH domain